MNPSSLIDQFIASKRLENRMSARSEESYRPVLAKWCEFVGAADAVSSATKRQVQMFLAQYDKPATRAHRRAVLRSFYEWMTYEELVPFNVVDQVKPIRYESLNTAEMEAA